MRPSTLRRSLLSGFAPFMKPRELEELERTPLPLLLIWTSSSNENYNGDCDLAIISDTLEWRQTILLAHRTYRTAKSRLPAMTEIQAHDPSCHFICYMEAEKTFGTDSLPPEGGYRILPVQHIPDSLVIQQTNLPVLCLDGDSIWWQAYLREISC